jgi:ribonuclease HII
VPSIIPDRVTLGIDEAGRGPILGPMVMAAVSLRPRAAASLTRAGVADSKAFAGPEAHQRRSALVPRILELAEHAAVAVIDVETIDAACAEHGLNRLEQRVATTLISAAPPAHRIVCDGARLFSPLVARFPALEAHDHGESVHVAVAAASILAKVRRDQIFACIWRRYASVLGLPHEPRGGGYLNDATRSLLRAIVAHLSALPPEGRHSWPWHFVADLLPVPLAPTPQLDLQLAELS